MGIDLKNQDCHLQNQAAGLIQYFCIFCRFQRLGKYGIAGAIFPEYGCRFLKNLYNNTEILL